jgi:type IV pilus assembly protein PilV
MEPAVYSNKSGFTLIELLVAMFIMTIGLLGLLQSVNVALLHNLSNQLRSEAVLVADEQMALEMTKPFDLISTNSTTPNTRAISRNINNAFKNYSVTKTGSNASSNTKSVVIAVKWQYKGQPYTHTISSLLSRYNQ